MGQTSCYVCGVSCHFWSEYNHSACPKCASDIHEKRTGIRPSDDQLRNGDGFPINSVWEEHIQKAKKEYLLNNKGTCYCCGKSCKDWKECGKYTYVSVCDSCNQKLRKFKYGTSEHTISNDGDGIPLCSEWNTVLDKVKSENFNVINEAHKIVMKIQTWDLLEGDRVQLRINDSTKLDGSDLVEGTFLARSDNGTAIIALDEEYHSEEYDSQNWYDQNIDGARLRDIAQRYNVKDISHDNLWTVEDDSISETKILKVLKHQVAKEVKAMPKDASTGREISWGQTFMKDSGKAAIRSGATLGIDGLKAGIKHMLTSNGMAGPGVTAVMEFFDTKLGDAALRAGLGYTLLGLPIPYIQENEYAQHLSEECRVSGLSGGMDQAAAMVKMFIVPALMEAFKNTPIMQGIEESANKARVAEGLAPKRVAPGPLPQEADELEIESDPFKAQKQAVA